MPISRDRKEQARTHEHETAVHVPWRRRISDHPSPFALPPLALPLIIPPSIGGEKHLPPSPLYLFSISYSSPPTSYLLPFKRFFFFVNQQHKTEPKTKQNKTNLLLQYLLQIPRYILGTSLHLPQAPNKYTQYISPARPSELNYHTASHTSLAFVAPKYPLNCELFCTVLHNERTSASSNETSTILPRVISWEARKSPGPPVIVQLGNGAARNPSHLRRAQCFAIPLEVCIPCTTTHPLSAA